MGDRDPSGSSEAATLGLLGGAAYVDRLPDGDRHQILPVSSGPE
jgi:hypothetical protein